MSREGNHEIVAAGLRAGHRPITLSGATGAGDPLFAGMEKIMDVKVY